MVSPFSALITRSRSLALLMFLAGFATLLSGVIVHFLTLPTELDASFRRALPLVEQRGVLRREDLPFARKLLTAAALTYVSVALQSLLNIARWWGIFRRGL
jgi:Zn-dependent membrane protease YugP